MAELEGLRRLIAELDAYIGAGRTVPTDRLAATLDKHAAGLPSDAPLKDQLAGLARRLRRDTATAIAESRLRAVVARLRKRADALALWLEVRDARLSDRR